MSWVWFMLQENEALLQNHSNHSRVNCFQIDLFSLSGENSCIFLFYITAHIIENKISHCRFFFFQCRAAWFTCKLSMKICYFWIKREVKNLNFCAVDRFFFCATFKTAEILSDKQLSVAQWPGFKCFQEVLLLMLVSKTTNRRLVCNRDMKLSDFHSPWRFQTPGCR